MEPRKPQSKQDILEQELSSLLDIDPREDCDPYQVHDIIDRLFERTRLRKSIHPIRIQIIRWIAEHTFYPIVQQNFYTMPRRGVRRWSISANRSLLGIVNKCFSTKGFAQLLRDYLPKHHSPGCFGHERAPNVLWEYYRDLHYDPHISQSTREWISSSSSSRPTAWAPPRLPRECTDETLKSAFAELNKLQALSFPQDKDAIIECFKALFSGMDTLVYGHNYRSPSRDNTVRFWAIDWIARRTFKNPYPFSRFQKDSVRKHTYVIKHDAAFWEFVRKELREVSCNFFDSLGAYMRMLSDRTGYLSANILDMYYGAWSLWATNGEELVFDARNGFCSEVDDDYWW